MSLADLFALTEHGADTYVGRGHPYPWGGLYGGHIVAQALVAATRTVEDGFVPHSVRAYFIRRGDNTETVRYEVDRIRNGRSFATRRVVARQSFGAILNLEASFQVREETAQLSPVQLPAGVPMPVDLALHKDTWMDAFQQKDIDRTLRFGDRDGLGQLMSWYRTTEDFGGNPILHMCALAYMSDDLPTGAVINAVPELRSKWDQENSFFSASLDHTVWFHRDVDMTKWHLFEMNCHAYVNGRGLAVGWVFAEDGTHVATVAQETLVRLNDRTQ